ncbi:MAG: hypothetical protein L0H63_16045, partial [Nitrococcus sp.]|nr:hypothetical protein [Nitrococcus sp.]
MNIRPVIQCSEIFFVVIMTFYASQSIAVTTICTAPSGADSRTILIHYPHLMPLPCQTFYVKYGVAKQIAWAKNTKGICEKVAAQVQ